MARKRYEQAFWSFLLTSSGDYTLSGRDAAWLSRLGPALRLTIVPLAQLRS